MEEIIKKKDEEIRYLKDSVKNSSTFENLDSWKIKNDEKIGKVYKAKYGDRKIAMKMSSILFVCTYIIFIMWSSFFGLDTW